MDNSFKLIVAQNIFYLRTQNQMTQLELAKRLNYSDKAISKWERGDGIPDAYVLKQMSELFGVTVDYILTEHTEQERKIDTKPAKKAKAMLANVIMIGITTVALLVFIILALSTGKYYWQIFIYILPAISIVSIVFSAILKQKIVLMLSISGLAWSILLVIFIALIGIATKYPIWLIFLLGIPIELIILLSFKIKITIKISQKESKNQTQVKEKE